MEAEVGLGDEWLSESSGSLGVTWPLWTGHSPCPGLRGQGVEAGLSLLRSLIPWKNCQWAGEFAFVFLRVIFSLTP